MRRLAVMLLLLGGCRRVVDLSPGDAGDGRDDAAPPGDAQPPDAGWFDDGGLAPDAAPPDGGGLSDAAL
jgi:hypothetical protein